MKKASRIRESLFCISTQFVIASRTVGGIEREAISSQVNRVEAIATSRNAQGPHVLLAMTKWVSKIE